MFKSQILAAALIISSVGALANSAIAKTVNYSTVNFGQKNFTAVYGEDNRQDLYMASAKWREIGRSLAGKVSIDRMKAVGNQWELQGVPLNKKVCPGQRFGEQMTVPTCTGFLVKQDVLITAAHCMKEADDCSKNNWVFEYALSNGSDSSANYLKVSADRVYKCSKVLSRRYENFGNVDYAIIQLDRPVVDRKPIAMGLDLPLVPGQAVTDIGHSSGLPLKFKDSAKILRVTPDGLGLDTDLDIFHGDSGSPVFDEATGLVIGITSHGHADHKHKDGAICSSVIVCKPEDGCYPSTSSNITNIKADPIFKTLFP